MAGDFDGDGWDDLFRLEYARSLDLNRDAEIYLNRPDATGSRKFVNTKDLSEELWIRGDLTNVIIGDFNGDGKDDFIRQEKGLWDDDSIRTVIAYLNISTTIGATTTISFKGFDLGLEELKGDISRLTVGDFNGDGKDDFIRQGINRDANDSARVYISSSSQNALAFEKASDINVGYLNGNLTDLTVGDFNGDGQDDFIRQEKGEWARDDDFTSQMYVRDTPPSGNLISFSKVDLEKPTAHKLSVENGRFVAGNFYGNIKTDLFLPGFIRSAQDERLGLFLSIADGKDALNGGAGEDELHGGFGDDTLNGGDGNDRLYGGAGNDNLWGGNGSDVADYSDAPRGVNVTLGWWSTIINDGHGNQDVLWEIENLSGSMFDDILSGESYSFDNIIDGLGGNDTIYGRDGNDTLNGGDGVDIVYGGNDNDALNGDNGNDRLFGENGDDTISGNAGDDVLQGNAGNDTLIGGDGNDLACYSGAISNYRLQHTGPGKYSLTSTLSSDATTAGDSLETVEVLQFGGSNANISLFTLNQGWFNAYGYLAANEDVRNINGIDIESASTHYLNNSARTWKKETELPSILKASANNIAATVMGNHANDHIFGGTLGDTLHGNGGSDYIFGAAGDDIISGGIGNDFLYGDNGNDRLFGGEGDDNLVGGAGDDWLTGGTGLLNTIDGGDGFDRACFEPILNSSTGRVDRGKLTITRINAKGTSAVTGFRVQDLTTNSSSTVGLSVERIQYRAGGSDVFYDTQGMLNWFNQSASRVSVSF